MKNKKNILVFIISFISLLIISIVMPLDNDQVWTYGFSYNIASGLVPYKDFNMIIGPLYSLVFSLPIVIFGNYLFAFKIFHIIIYSLIITYVCKGNIKNTILLVLTLLIQQNISCYNAFVAMLTVLILALLDSKNKYKDFIIGLLIGIIIMTKHNVGLALLIVYFFTTKKKKNLVSVFIPIIISTIYLMCNNALWQYINFCFLGMGNFTENLLIEPTCLLLIILLCVYYIKKYFNTKDVRILYMLAFLIILLFPLIEFSHFLFGIIPTTYYILFKEEKKEIYILMIIFIALGMITNIIYKYKNNNIILDDNYYKYNSLSKGAYQSTKNYTKYIDKLDGEVYLLTSDAYNIKLYNNQTTSFYDLLNKGNLGRNEYKYVKKMEKECKNKKCYFILGAEYFKTEKEHASQILVIFKDYVIKNYNYIETLPSGDKVYSN